MQFCPPYLNSESINVIETEEPEYVAEINPSVPEPNSPPSDRTSPPLTVTGNNAPKIWVDARCNLA